MQSRTGSAGTAAVVFGRSLPIRYDCVWQLTSISNFTCERLDYEMRGGFFSDLLCTQFRWSDERRCCAKYQGLSETDPSACDGGLCDGLELIPNAQLPGLVYTCSDVDSSWDSMSGDMCALTKPAATHCCKEQLGCSYAPTFCHDREIVGSGTVEWQGETLSCEKVAAILARGWPSLPRNECEAAQSMEAVCCQPPCDGGLCRGDGILNISICSDLHASWSNFTARQCSGSRKALQAVCCVSVPVLEAAAPTGCAPLCGETGISETAMMPGEDGQTEVLCTEGLATWETWLPEACTGWREAIEDMCCSTVAGTVAASGCALRMCSGSAFSDVASFPDENGQQVPCNMIPSFWDTLGDDACNWLRDNLESQCCL